MRQGILRILVVETRIIAKSEADPAAELPSCSMSGKS